MSVPWPTHRVKAHHAKAQRRAKRRRDSKLAKAAHAEQQRRAVAAA